MKLSASLLALVAAVPAVVSAFSTARPGSSDPVSLEYWGRVLLGAIREHIDLAKLTVNFIAKNFENPPHPGSDRMRAANPEFTILAPGYIQFVDRGNGFFPFRVRHGDQALLTFISGELAPGIEPNAAEVIDAAKSLRRLNHLISLNNPGDNFRINVQAPLQFNTSNFETNGVHVLRDGAQARAERFWEFYRNIRDSVLSEVPASDDVGEQHQGIVHHLPPVPPGILRSTYSGRWNRKGQLTNEAVREVLLVVAIELSRCFSELYDAESDVEFPRDFARWLERFTKLQKAISKIRIYDNGPLCAHALAISRLFNDILHRHAVEVHRFHELTITKAANFARAMI